MKAALVSTFGEIVREREGAAGHAPFVVSPDTSEVLSYGALWRTVAALDAMFDERGVDAGEIVGFMLPNGIAAASAFVATMAAGRIVAPFNLLAQDAHLDYVLSHAQPRLLFTTHEYAARLTPAIERAGVTTRLVIVTSDSLDLDASDHGNQVPDVSPDSPAMLMYTSGTTGMPKGVLLSHANMLHAGATVASHHGLGASDRVLSSLPLYHINGQCIAMVSTLVAGASAVLPYRFSTSQWWGIVERFTPTWLNLVPTIVAYLLNGPDLTPAQASAATYIRFARAASAPLPPEQQRAFEARFGISIVEAMGLTESASIAFCNPLERANRRIGSPGLPFGVEARVVDATHRELPDDVSGEIEIRGPSVMLGYYRAPELTAKALHDGWFATGDLGYRDTDGYYFITGRSKELIIKGGENIAPREIDEALLKHPAILEAAAVGVPDARYGQEILACIVLKDGATLDADELIMFCMRELGRYKTPRYVRFVNELPKGPSGKVQRMRLAAESVELIGQSEA
ncbi:MAG TPA: AMP-binding protein [Casimicrobiaceae bacterium]|nr:AMP-binding protein [Casimicrobiaceae bacterium]